jgi:H+-transporting ATPase
MGLGMEELRTLSVVAIVFGAQAIMYATRERRHFLGLRPTIWVVGSSFVDIIIISTLAARGIAMAPLPVSVVASELVAAVAFWLVLGLIKIPIFARLGIA